MAQAVKLLKPAANQDRLVWTPHSNIVRDFEDKQGPSRSSIRRHSLLTIPDLTLHTPAELYGDRQFLAWLHPRDFPGDWPLSLRRPQA